MDNRKSTMALEDAVSLIESLARAVLLLVDDRKGLERKVKEQRAIIDALEADE